MIYIKLETNPFGIMEAPKEKKKTKQNKKENEIVVGKDSQHKRGSKREKNKWQNGIFGERSTTIIHIDRYWVGNHSFGHKRGSKKSSLFIRIFYNLGTKQEKDWRLIDDISFIYINA